MCVLLSTTGHILKNTPIQGESSNLEGVYELVSETTEIIAPKKQANKKAPPDWKGLWIFRKGHFARFLMKVDKPFMKGSKREEEYQSSGGIYTIEKNTLRLRLQYAYSVYDVERPVDMEFSLEDDTLKLTQKLHSHLEDLREGNITIILRKVKE